MVCRVGRAIGGVSSWGRCSADSLGGVGPCDGCSAGSASDLSSDCARAADTTSKPEPTIRMANEVRDMIRLSFRRKLPQRNSFHRSSPTSFPLYRVHSSGVNSHGNPQRVPKPFGPPNHTPPRSVRSASRDGAPLARARATRAGRAGWAVRPEGPAGSPREMDN